MAYRDRPRYSGARNRDNIFVVNVKRIGFIFVIIPLQYNIISDTKCISQPLFLTLIIEAYFEVRNRPNCNSDSRKNK